MVVLAVGSAVYMALFIDTRTDTHTVGYNYLVGLHLEFPFISAGSAQEIQLWIEICWLSLFNSNIRRKQRILAHNYKFNVLTWILFSFPMEDFLVF